MASVCQVAKVRSSSGGAAHWHSRERSCCRRRRARHCNRLSDPNFRYVCGCWSANSYPGSRGLAARTQPVDRTGCSIRRRAVLACCATGLPLWRVTLHTATLHPQVAGLGLRWWRDRGVTEEFTIALGAEESSEFLSSPIRDSVLKGKVARFRLTEIQGREFPLLRRLQEAGGTDYLTLPLFRLLDRYPVTTWATDAQDGFTVDHIARLSALVPVLAVVIEARLMRRIARDLLDTYLGRQAGQRVLAGQIRRGCGERVRAVIMASDLRGSTALSDHLPPDEVIELLDAYFERVAEPVQTHGGDVLKFLGDGVLAIFPIAELGEMEAATAALQAAAEILGGLAAYSHAPERRGRSPLRAGIGLHLGEVIYGNVGAPIRLDFTVIGLQSI